jgi:transcriptional regulator with XRE-family HTH domain
MDGKQLRSIRTRLKLTQVQMANEVGVAPNTIARYERDELPIPEPTARLILKLNPPNQGRKRKR